MIRIIACMVLLSGPVFAGIEWKQNEVRLQVHPTQVAAAAVFTFANTGDGPVSISDVVITCGCLSAQPLKPSYAPGEEGSLTIMVDLRNREGELRKTVVAKTDAGTEQALTIVVDIPKAYEIDKPLMFWEEGNGMEDKTAHLVNPNAMAIKLHSITSSNELLPAELKTIREGFEYEVVVHRATDKADVRSVIRIATEPPPGEEEAKIIKLYACTL